MTRKSTRGRPAPSRTPAPAHWPLQDAKARFSELVRRVKAEGPQTVTVHGRDEVVVVAAEEYRRLAGSATGQALVEAMQACPYPDFDLAPSERSPVKPPERLS
jgi:prevent-host-death family protein